jgi:hypothetical protein
MLRRERAWNRLIDKPAAAAFARYGTLIKDILGVPLKIRRTYGTRKPNRDNVSPILGI